MIEKNAGAVARCNLAKTPAVKVKDFPDWIGLRALLSDARGSGTGRGMEALKELRILLRDVTHHAADEMLKAGAASPEPHGEHRARLDASTAAQATPAFGPAAGETVADGNGSRMVQLAGSNTPSAK